jgi:hypothetical protein
MDEGVFMTTASNAAGPWAPVTRVWDSQGWDDPAPFWDDDGHAYLILSNPGNTQDNLGKWVPHLFKLSRDGTRIDAASAKVLDAFSTSEGNKLYKINGLYYFFHNEYHRKQNVRVGVMMRAHSLNGPWEKKTILEDAPGWIGPNRGRGLVLHHPAGPGRKRRGIFPRPARECGCCVATLHGSDRDLRRAAVQLNTGEVGGWLADARPD